MAITSADKAEDIVMMNLKSPLCPILLIAYTILTGCSDSLPDLACEPASKTVLALHEPKLEAEKATEWVSEALGVRNQYKLYAADFEPGRSPNAYAIFACDELNIVYDRSRLFTSRSGVVLWREIATIAHEISHHTNGATYLNPNSRHREELAADKGSGHVMRLMGANIEQAVSTAERFSNSGSSTHPGRKDREQAIRDGWQTADKLISRTSEI
jgi:hypothetical protein